MLGYVFCVSFWFLVLVSVFSQVELGFVYFPTWHKDFIGLWILELGICRSWRGLTVVVCVMPLVHVVIIMADSIIHLVGTRVGGEWRII